MKLLYGDSAARKVSERVALAAADLPTLRGYVGNRIVDGMIALVQNDGVGASLWQFSYASQLVDDGLFAVEPTDGSAGAWLRMPGFACLDLPITFNTADAAILLTVPTGALVRPLEFNWKVSVNFTGGASSAIGVSSSTLSGKTTKGDLLGGAGGEVAATLLAASGEAFMGTIGAQWATIANRRILMKATDTLRFDRIVSAFTAGTGSVRVACEILKNLGA